MLWDVEKFYDDISIVALGLAAVRRGYPSTPLALAIMLYIGPRLLSQSQAVGFWVQPYNSILQGDNQANCIAKLILYECMDVAKVTAFCIWFAGSLLCSG